MNETKQLLEHAERAFDPPTDVMEALVDRRDRKHRNERLRAGALGLAIAVAIGWLSVSAIRSAPVPADPVIRENGEVLRFTGRIERDRLPDGSILKPMPGDLVAVDPRSGAERVLVEDLDAVYWAGWSADGRWYAYETDSAEGVWHRDVWVAGGSQAPRVVATIDDGIFGYGPAWQWSPTGAELATVDHEEARTIDVATGTAETTDLGPAVAGVGEPGFTGRPAWAWSPDGRRLVFASLAGDGSLYSIDVRSGERSLLARLPDVTPPFDPNKILWSPDGAHIALPLGEGDDRGRLFVMDADGSDIRLVTDDNNSLGVAWSPDGTRLAFGSVAEMKVRIRVTTADGAAPAEIGTIHRGPCATTTWGANNECSLTWSPDGTQVAILRPGSQGGRGGATVFPANGAGEGEALEELTFAGWDSGWYRSDWDA